MAVPFTLTKQCQIWLAQLVSESIEDVFREQNTLCPEVPTNFSKEEQEQVQAKLGAFVTLTLHGQLRGCIGSIVAYEPLYQNVWHMARAAAFQDPRFRPVDSLEWNDICAEISVLSEPTLCPDPSKIVVGQHGLILKKAGRTGVFLPQVPVEQRWSLSEYLEHLCLKAGLPKGSWQDPEASLYWYEALVFPVR
ncbi:MAG: AmmeMemoRadiSam system protein A [Desulfovibrio sp.]|nr:AmmeMemoRadiSam system protein A [Desulfovibrio sp.]